MLTQIEAQNLFLYEPESGRLIWRNCGKPHKNGLEITGRTPSGIRVKVNGKQHLAHQIIYTYMTGKKASYVSHKDGNPYNNKWENIQDSSFYRDKTLTQAYLKEHFSYDPETGDMTRIKVVRGVQPDSIGRPIRGKDRSGYYRVRINDKDYYVHRLAFLYMLGEIPEFVDHINHVRTDNRWHNLRPCTQQQNQWNQKVRKDSATGHKGVTIEPKVIKYYRARIYKSGKEYDLGLYETVEEASEAYNKKAIELFGQFAVLNDI